MMRAITEPELEQEERDVASSLMLLYLVGGLASGALLSFVSGLNAPAEVINSSSTRWLWQILSLCIG